MNQGTAKAIHDYIAAFPAEGEKALEELRALVLATAPGASERISYGIINFELNGRNLVYFGGWKKHIGFYPVTRGVEKALGDELKPWKSGKGSLRFPLGQPLPADLIRRIVLCRIEEVRTAGLH